ncbi:MAG: hypothetical protein KF886_03470 [Candidatus Hydrogenedentes bacterium]|nr:hypothetical protein [Candidatus Hydrogenedentota bacterium]
MSAVEDSKDLVVLAADKDMEHAVKGILGRWKSLQIRELTWDIFVHPNRDPGCLLEAHEFLRDHSGRYRRAIIMLDRDGCGKESSGASAIESGIEERLRNTGWDGRCAAIALVPELEAWVWSDSSEVPRVLGWAGVQPQLRDQLIAQGLLEPNHLKPVDPKRALEFALKRVKIPRSASIYHQIACSVSLSRCEDPAFNKFKTTLQSWFPVGSED